MCTSEAMTAMHASRPSSESLSNSSELSAILSGNNHPAVPRAPSSKRASKSLYQIPENYNEESALPSNNSQHHASKLIANRHRSSAASVLYNNIMNKRNSTGISARHYKGNVPGTASTGPGTLSRHNSKGSLNIIINENAQGNKDASIAINGSQLNGRSSNPISHYEVNRNATLRFKSSSTTCVPTRKSLPEQTARPGLSNGARANSFMNAHAMPGSEEGISKKSGMIDYTQGGRFFPQFKIDATQEGGKQTVSSKDLEDEESLASQIETAIMDDLFPKDYTFDNKFDGVDVGEVDLKKDDVPSVTSSNQSPLTKRPHHKNSEGLFTRRNSFASEDSQKDVSSKADTIASDNNFRNDNNMPLSRLQIKMNALKSRFDSFASAEETPSGYEDYFSALLCSGDTRWSSTDESQLSTASGAKPFPVEYPTQYSRDNHILRNNSHDQHILISHPKTQECRFWSNHDLHSRLLLEQLSNQLNLVQRFSSSGKAGEKVLVSRLKQLIKDEPTRMQLSWIWHQKPSGPATEKPVLRTFDETRDLPFEELYALKKGGPHSEDFHDPFSTIKDEALQKGMKTAKASAYKLWKDSEMSEFTNMPPFDDRAYALHSNDTITSGAGPSSLGIHLLQHISNSSQQSGSRSSYSTNPLPQVIS